MNEILSRLSAFVLVRCGPYRLRIRPEEYESAE
jgi:hypothetical protein